MKKFVLYAAADGVYAGLKGATVTAEETKEAAVVFDSAVDNVMIKQRFYNAVTGCSFKAVAL